MRSPRLIGNLALLLIGFLFLSSILLLVIFPSTIARHAALEPPPSIPQPRLQIDEAADLAKLRAREEAALTRYGWVDRAQGIAHIPIDEAMRRVAARGIADWPKAEP